MTYRQDEKYKFIASQLFFFIDMSSGLSRLYCFIAGSKTVTPLGAEKHIILKFKHGCPAQCKCRPTAATCDPSITFPMHYNDSKDFEQAGHCARRIFGIWPCVIYYYAILSYAFP